MDQFLAQIAAALAASAKATLGDLSAAFTPDDETDLTQSLKFFVGFAWTALVESDDAKAVAAVDSAMSALNAAQAVLQQVERAAGGPGTATLENTMLGALRLGTDAAGRQLQLTLPARLLAARKG